MEANEYPGCLAALAIAAVLMGCPSGPPEDRADESGVEITFAADAERETDRGSSSGDSGPRIVEIDSGEAHTLVLLADGSVWSCGNGGDGQLGWIYDEECFSAVRIDGLPKIRDVAAGSAFSIFIAEDGSVWGAGYGHDERLGPTPAERFETPIEIGVGGLVDAVAYTNFTVGRRADGSVVTWGVNDAGGLGSGSSDDSATLVETGVTASAVSAGGSYALALVDGGRVKAWGMNNYGTLGNPSVAHLNMRASSMPAASIHTYSLSPVDVSIDGVVAIAAGTEHALALREDGTVWGWGRNIEAFRGAAGPTNR